MATFEPELRACDLCQVVSDYDCMHTPHEEGCSGEGCTCSGVVCAYCCTDCGVEA